MPTKNHSNHTLPPDKYWLLAAKKMVDCVSEAEYKEWNEPNKAYPEWRDRLSLLLYGDFTTGFVHESEALSVFEKLRNK